MAGLKFPKKMLNKTQSRNGLKFEIYAAYLLK